MSQGNVIARWPSHATLSPPCCNYILTASFISLAVRVGLSDRFSSTWTEPVAGIDVVRVDVEQRSHG